MIVKALIITPTINTIIVHVTSDIPNPFQPMLTRKVVIFAIVAIVIQPKYTLNGSLIKNRSLKVSLFLLISVTIIIKHIKMIIIKTTVNGIKL